MKLKWKPRNRLGKRLSDVEKFLDSAFRQVLDIQPRGRVEFWRWKSL